MRMGSPVQTACWMRATAMSMPSMSIGSMRWSSDGVKRVWAPAECTMPRETRSLAMAWGQRRFSARCWTAASSAERVIHGGGPTWAVDIVFLLVAVVDYDAAEVGDGLHEVLEAVVPVGCDFEDEHDALMCES